MENGHFIIISPAGLFAWLTKINPIIKNGILCEKKNLELPKTITNVVYCKNPRCITSTEQELKHVFNLREDGTYRCMYCEAKAIK